MIGREGGGNPDEKRQGVNRQREQQPAEKANGKDRKDKADNNHGGALRAKLNGLRLHHPPRRQGILAHSARNEHCIRRNDMARARLARNGKVYGKVFATSGPFADPACVPASGGLNIPPPA
jgi:hypothetical protein